MAGLRVVRGKDWKWQDQDGGDGGVGFVTENEKGWASILWDNGFSNKYRAGSKTDLLLLDSGPAGTTHPCVQCDSCNEAPVKGIRWKCAVCEDYDLCTECYGNDKHDMSHKFLRIDVPSKKGVKIGRRTATPKYQSKGIYPGAIVVRGQGWTSGNKDNGSGNIGLVTKDGYTEEDGELIHCCLVRWPNSTDDHACCLGWSGRVDIQYKTAAVGWGYYKSHLPALKDVEGFVEKTEIDDSDEELSDAFSQLLMVGVLAVMKEAKQNQESKQEHRAEVMAMFNPGDQVKLSDNIEEVKRLQEKHGGYNLLMKASLGTVGKVKEVDEDGDVMVSFGDMNWSLNSELLTKQTANKFQVGDQVNMDSDVELVKKLQANHSGWNDSMRKSMSTVGKVMAIDEDGDVKVDFGGTQWTLNPEACHQATGAANTSTSPNRSSTKKNEVQYPVITSHSEDTSGQKALSGCKFNIGDYISLEADIDFVKKRQKGHGGLNDRMKEAMTTPRQIVDIDNDGDLKVQVGEDTWTFNPEACLLMPSGASPKREEARHPTHSGVAASPKPPVGGNKLPGMTVLADKGSDCQFSVDEEVKLGVSVDHLRIIQRGHGGWNPAMSGLAGKVGTVKQVTADGDVRVQFHCGTFLLNPAAFVSVNQGKAKARKYQHMTMKSSNTMTNEKSAQPEFWCKVCHEATINVVFNCGHACCSVCAPSINICHVCGSTVTNKYNMDL